MRRTKYAQEKLEQLKRILSRKPTRHKKITTDTYFRLLQGCITMKALVEGRQIHIHMLQNAELKPHSFLWNVLMDMYVKCGDLIEARFVFDKLVHRTAHSWAQIMAAYLQHQRSEEVLHLLVKMHESGIKPHTSVFVCALRACSSIGALAPGETIHMCVIDQRFESDLSVAQALVKMYCKCGCLQHAEHEFNRLSEKDLTSWSAMIAGCTLCGYYEKAIQLFRKMQQDGVNPNIIIFSMMLKICTDMTSLLLGKEIHEQLKDSEFASTVSLNIDLIHMYIEFNDIPKACQIFSQMATEDLVAWNASSSGSIDHHFLNKALCIFCETQCKSPKPDIRIITRILNVCGGLRDLRTGMEIHSFMLKKGLDTDSEIAICLVDMYNRCQNEDAQYLLERMPKQVLES